MPEPAEDFGCGVFAKDGVSESPVAFRACLERSVAGTRCEGGSSPDLATLELAVVLVDGVGGARNIPRARELLGACFRDIAVQTVLEHADAKEKNAQTPPFATCEEFAQTTFGIAECLHERVDNERAWLKRERRAYDATTRPIFDKATSAAEAWARALGMVAYARYDGGTMRNPAMVAQLYGAMTQRRTRLASIRAWVPDATVTAAERTRTRDELANALRRLDADAEPNEKRALQEEERSWVEYRDAEAHLYDALHPGARAQAMFELVRVHARDMRGLVQDP